MGPSRQQVRVATARASVECSRAERAATAGLGGAGSPQGPRVAESLVLLLLAPLVVRFTKAADFPAVMLVLPCSSAGPRWIDEAQTYLACQNEFDAEVWWPPM